MDIIWSVLIGGWIIGWLASVASVHAGADKKGISKPPAVWCVVVVWLLFAWPYFYFYWRAQ